MLVRGSVDDAGKSKRYGGAGAHNQWGIAISVSGTVAHVHLEVQGSKTPPLLLLFGWCCWCHW